MVLFVCSSTCLAQSSAVEPAARREIDAGNQAWIDGMKQGDVERIVATYTADAVDCDPEGHCLQGRSAIRKHMKAEMARFGKAESASVDSAGSVQQGLFVYEWGQAEARFAHGKKMVDRYLTAWRNEQDGSWRIFRNMVIPSR
ncbi:YybH family protein [Silvibacterium acidisoli]|uniref:YybH family protein n=1 Tax=Acidobacteriaceae bacterium ZG23-2 TaxID=2883246 RepID=UPI00406C0AC0